MIHGQWLHLLNVPCWLISGLKSCDGERVQVIICALISDAFLCDFFRDQPEELATKRGKRGRKKKERVLEENFNTPVWAKRRLNRSVFLSFGLKAEYNEIFLSTVSPLELQVTA